MFLLDVSFVPYFRILLSWTWQRKCVWILEFYEVVVLALLSLIISHTHFHTHFQSHIHSVLTFFSLRRLQLVLERWGECLCLCFSGACSYWFLVSVAKYPGIPGLKIKRISKELFLFPGSYPVLQTRFSPSKKYVCRNTCDLPPEGFASCYGMCPFIRWRIWCMSLLFSPGVTAFYKKPIQVVTTKQHSCAWEFRRLVLDIHCLMPTVNSCPLMLTI